MQFQVGERVVINVPGRLGEQAGTITRVLKTNARYFNVRIDSTGKVIPAHAGMLVEAGN